jgi:hypothetical protein
LVLDRVPFLLPRVVRPLTLLGAVRRPLGGVEEQFLDLVPSQFDLPLGDAEEARQERFEPAVALRDTVLSSMPNRNPRNVCGT